MAIARSSSSLQFRCEESSVEPSKPPPPATATGHAVFVASDDAGYYLALGERMRREREMTLAKMMRTSSSSTATTATSSTGATSAAGPRCSNRRALNAAIENDYESDCEAADEWGHFVDLDSTIVVYSPSSSSVADVAVGPSSPSSSSSPFSSFEDRLDFAAKAIGKNLCALVAAWAESNLWVHAFDA